MFRFNGEDKAQCQTEKCTHQDPVVRRQTERNGVCRDPENDDRFGQERTPGVSIQPLDEFCTADKTLVLDAAVEPFVGEHHGIAEDDVQPERGAERKNQRVPAVVNLEGPDRSAGKCVDSLGKQSKDQREEHTVKTPDNKLQKEIVRLVTAGASTGLDHFAEGCQNGDFQKAGDVGKFVDKITEVLESGQICRAGAGNVDPAPAAGTEGEEKDQGSKKNEKQTGKNVSSFHTGKYPFNLCL